MKTCHITWKTPEYYTDKSLQNSCEYSIRQEIGCTEKFFESGFLKNSHWDHYAEYNMLCKNCPHYYHNIGIYFGNGKTSDNLKQWDTVWCLCRISSHEEFLQAISVLPKGLKAIFFDDIRIEAASELEQFEQLECVLFSYNPKLMHFWDFSKTPNLKVLKYVANTQLTDLSELDRAKNLEYLGIETLVSRTNLNYVDSFYPLTKLGNLKELLIEATMCSDNNIENLIAIPKLEKLWISPHTFSTEDFAKFEAKKFKIYDEYGVYKNGDDYVRPLGKGRRCFQSENAKEKFIKEYKDLMGRE